MTSKKTFFRTIWSPRNGDLIGPGHGRMQRSLGQWKKVSNLYQKPFLKKVAGTQMFMYFGRRRTPQSFGDYRDLETNTKFSMICVKADKDPTKKPFWLAKVTGIVTHEDDVPDRIKLTWFTVDSDDSALDGKYFPEKSKSSNKLLEDKLSLKETTVYAYNFALLANKTLPAVTKRIIQTALNE